VGALAADVGRCPELDVHADGWGLVGAGEGSDARAVWWQRGAPSYLARLPLVW
jgi:hypothetical protein